ncbi:MAG: ATP-dependent helicase C-terminal domain-containing protein, partial [Myxococcota bacterium]
DLAEGALFLLGAGVDDLDRFAWFQPPPAAALAAAIELLSRLGAIDPDRMGAGSPLTAIGQRMLRFPVHPRQARMLVEAEDRGVAESGCTLAALVGNKELRAERRAALGRSRGRGPSDRVGGRGSSNLADGRGLSDLADGRGPSDLIDDLDRLSAVAYGGRPSRSDLASRARRDGLDPSAVIAVDRSRRQLTRLVADSGPGERTRRPKDEDERERALLQVILTGYPDRVGRRRAPGSRDIVLAGGGSATLDPSSVVADAAFVVAVDVDERSATPGPRRAGSAPARRAPRIRRASAVDPAWLLDLYIDRIEDRDELVWNSERERVERVASMRYDGLVIDDSRDPVAARQRPEQAASILAKAALERGREHFLARFLDRAEFERWHARLAFAAQRSGDGGPLPDRSGPLADDELRAIVERACLGLLSFAELERASLMEIIRGQLSAEQRALVERLAPAFVSIPGRRRIPVRYEIDRPPWIESRLQDFFGLDRGPAVADGAVPLVLHLLAPNRRAVQVTSDLTGFWSRHYPDL